MTPLTNSVFYVDNSSIDLITTCPWLAYAQIVLRKRPTGESAALRYGGFIHRALAYRYMMEGYGRPYREDIMLRILDHWFTTKPLESEGWRNLASATKTIRGYNAAWPREQFKVMRHPRTRTPIVEQPIAIDTGVTLRGRRIIYMGRIDLVYTLPNDMNLVMDHKTTSMLGDSFWLDQAVSAQPRGYLWSIRKAFGFEPDGYEINAIAGRESIANAEFDEITGKLVMTSAKSKAVPLELSRQRFFTRVPSGQLEEWYENMLMVVETFLRYVDGGVYPRHRKHCVGKYGNCPMYPVCSLPPGNREDAINGGAYEENTWSPLYV